MKQTASLPIIVIDFDSTFITVEALDELAVRCLKDDPDRQLKQEQIAQITAQGMSGEMPFRESLLRRLALFAATRDDISGLVPRLRRSVTPSIKRNRQFFRNFGDQIYIISGGFREYILPVVSSFGISEDHVLANSFTFDSEGLITGFDKTNFLSKSGGKSQAIRKIRKENPNQHVIVIGDGYTDLETRLTGTADRFYAFTENVRRDSVVKQADKEIVNFDELLFHLKLPASVSYPKNRIKVLLLEKIHPFAVQRFRQEGYTVTEISSALSEEELITELKTTSILGIRSKTKVTKRVLEAAPKLLAIGAFCIGTNQIDLETAAKKGIAVFNAPFSNTRSVVEITLGSIIMLMRQAFERSTKLHAGIWDKSASGSHEIRGKKLGIIGYGNIGSQLSVLAEALGMEVYFYDIVEKLALGNARQCSSLKELLKMADVVSIHVDGRPENTDLISDREFSLMKDGVIFLNFARGNLINVNSLQQAILSGKVAGAAVDVFPQEPKSNDEKLVTPLQGLPNIILTPHIGGSTVEAQENIGLFVSDQIITYVNQGTTSLSVNIPPLQLPPLKNDSRLIHLHHNTYGILAQINQVLAANRMNIEGQYLKTNELIGYVIVDTNKRATSAVQRQLEQIAGTIRVRILY
ncbi:MAG: phosphoglycerate dehydrogenase [Patescibacteria group bacterium]